MEGTGEGLAALGFRPGRRHAFTGVVEPAGGVLLALGWRLRWPPHSLTLSVMIAAAVSVQVKNGVFIVEGGFEYNLVFGVGALTLAFTGPGSWSIDAVLGWDYGSRHGALRHSPWRP